MITKRKKVLVIDDDEMHIYTTKELLDSDHIEVIGHRSWIGATNCVRDMEPDLVLLDINMPGLSGETLSGLIKPYCNFISAPIIFHSSNDEESLRESVRMHGVRDYICKGNIASLRSKVSTHLRLDTCTAESTV